MKKLLLTTILFTTYAAIGQINYTVDILRLKALADNCDGGAPFCLNAPQDPIFNIWTTDGGGNENTYCWIFEDDATADYGMWIDIQNVQIASETNVMTTYINVEMSGFETDALFSASCSSSSGDDADEPRQLAQQFTLASIPMSTPYIATVNIAGIYFAEVQIEWVDPSATVDELQTFVSVFPNPAENSIKLNISNNEPYNIQLVDLSGRSVLTTSGQNGSEIDLSNLERGNYLLNVRNLNGVQIHRENLIVR